MDHGNALVHMCDENIRKKWPKLESKAASPFQGLVFWKGIHMMSFDNGTGLVDFSHVDPRF